MVVKFASKEKRNTDLSFESEYKVLSIDHVQKLDEIGCFEVKFRVLNDNGIAALYNPNIFKVVDSNLDKDFVYKSYDNGNYEFVPYSMSYPYFWDHFFDDDEKAISIFKERFPEYKDKLF
ncbi:MAG: hypothetical protein AAFP89_25700 [Bacteroidota bacterium]